MTMQEIQEELEAEGWDIEAIRPFISDWNTEEEEE